MPAPGPRIGSRSETNGGEDEELVVADLDYGNVRQARFQLPTVIDSNLDLIHREIERLNNRLGVPRGIRST
jgi:N-carbamoylputrescine amidase